MILVFSGYYLVHIYVVIFISKGMNKNRVNRIYKDKV